MVFNKYYDRALLLMLLGDKDNNGMIINFLKFIPESMYKYIKDSISLNSYMANSCELRSICFDSMHMLNNDGFIYDLNLMIYNGMLIIDLHRVNVEMEIDEKINLSLQPLKRYDLDKNSNVGSFTYELDIINSFSGKSKKEHYSKQYNIKKIPFDNVIVTSLHGISGIISIKSCFEEISFESLFNDVRFNKCGKKRILSNKKKRI